MEALLIVGGLFFLVIVPILAISGNVRAGTLRRDVERLDSIIAHLQRRILEFEKGASASATPEAEPLVAAPIPEPSRPPEAAIEPEPTAISPVLEQPVAPEPAKPK